jgi:hypothetical protein
MSHEPICKMGKSSGLLSGPGALDYDREELACVG